MSLKQCEEVREYLPTSHLSHFRSIKWSFTYIGLNSISHLPHMDVILRKKCKADAIREENRVWISQFLLHGLLVIKAGEIIPLDCIQRNDSPRCPPPRPLESLHHNETPFSTWGMKNLRILNACTEFRLMK